MNKTLTLFILALITLPTVAFSATDTSCVTSDQLQASENRMITEIDGIRSDQANMKTEITRYIDQAKIDLKNQLDTYILKYAFIIVGAFAVSLASFMLFMSFITLTKINSKSLEEPKQKQKDKETMDKIIKQHSFFKFRKEKGELGASTDSDLVKRLKKVAEKQTQSESQNDSPTNTSVTLSDISKTDKLKKE